MSAPDQALTIGQTLIVNGQPVIVVRIIRDLEGRDRPKVEVDLP